MTGDTQRKSNLRKVYLAAEYALVFFGVVVFYTLLFSGANPIPLLVVLGVAAVFYLLRSPSFDRGSLWRPGRLPAELPSIAFLWFITAVGSTVVVLFTRPDLFLGFPRTEPVMWGFVMVLYPVLSVYPQELIFRAFMFQRYQPIFGDGYGMIAASAVAFGFVHIAFGNWISVVLSAAGGWIFASRYRKSRSLFTVSVEHGLYGMLMFTVGLGIYFYHGA
ncbi:CPBP family intramembrane metalloprotease [Kibdelosporangium philippinense]|uniref:CPBP family intramembrane metalloprotease n=1 Tax=Kibdelosporangium philippinense TaxID=211113 RepID=A0ABS8ZET6_9PSEU|nr:CPBP family intramembrane glutamic endopeptidase [Kibdelosporangium philippinense]MCE7006329.1 CPBP family intramembrane metalloprotease [Kibdelosporangium philippinense]